MNINFIYKPMPASCGAYTRHNNDGSHTIVMNERLNFEQQKTAYMHELTHIDGNDWDMELQADLIEEMRHRSKDDSD